MSFFVKTCYNRHLFFTIIAMSTIRHLLSTHHSIPRHWLKEWLLFVLKKSPTFLISHSDYILSDDELQKFNDGLSKLQNGTPLAYLIGSQGFFGNEFIVNEHTLIPRPDSEILIETALTLAKDLDCPAILDLGTGTGCLAISLDLKLKNAQITAVDCSLNALEIAKQNNHKLNAKVQFIHSNWFNAIQGQFDMIISNPPYIAKNDEHLKQLIHEPITALVSDDDGLADIKHIIGNACHYLKTGGYLLIEHGYNQGQMVQQLFTNHHFYHIRTIKDYGGNDRVTLGQYIFNYD